jgi:hypothetical protein
VLLSTLVITLVSLSINQARAGEQTRFYGPDGRSTGTATTSGNTTTFYGADGRRTGSATTSSWRVSTPAFGMDGGVSACAPHTSNAFVFRLKSARRSWDAALQYLFDHVFLDRSRQNLPHELSDAQMSQRCNERKLADSARREWEITRYLLASMPSRSSPKPRRWRLSYERLPRSPARK